MSTQPDTTPAPLTNPEGFTSGYLQATGITSPPERITYAQHLGLGPQDIPLPPAPITPPWTDPVFYSTTIIPIVLAVIAAIFHKDLTQYATQFAYVAAAIATLGYSIYSASKHQAHAKALAAYYGMHAALFTSTTSRAFR